MTATERLRELLDERGVEWTSPGELYSRFADSMTFIGSIAVVSEIEGSNLLRINFDGTPEQAITATLGRETCRTVQMDCFGNPPFNTSGLSGNSTACGCSECGAPWSTVGLFRGNQLHHNFKACPICGREVVDG